MIYFLVKMIIYLPLVYLILITKQMKKQKLIALLKIMKMKFKDKTLEKFFTKMKFIIKFLWKIYIYNKIKIQKKVMIVIYQMKMNFNMNKNKILSIMKIKTSVKMYRQNKY